VTAAVTRAEALAAGFTIDDHCTPPFAYRGPRFQPTETVRLIQRPEQHYVLETLGGKQWVFIAPSDEAAAKMAEYRARVDVWADGTAWSVSRYYPLVVDEEGRTEVCSEISNMVGNGIWRKPPVAPSPDLKDGEQ